MPAHVLVKIMQTFFLPQLARAQDDGVEFRRLYLVTVQAALVSRLAIALGFAILGPSLLLVLYGEKYGSAVSVLAWLAIAQGLRIARAGPTIVAISKGNTVNPLLSNMARVLMLPVAWVAVSFGASIQMLVALAMIGEALALALSLLLLRRRVGLALRDLRIAFATSLGALVLIGMQPYARTTEFALTRPEPIDFAAVLAVILAGCSLRELRKWGRSNLV
jgi:O-antigen/teichoic acid export membrane protein